MNASLTRLRASLSGSARLLVAAVLLGLATRVVTAPYLERIDQSALQAAYRQRSNSMAWARQITRVNAWKDKVVLLTVDEETLQQKEFSTWPLPRKLYGDLLHRLHRGQVRAVAFDILFDSSQDALSPRNDQVFSEALRACPEGILADHVVTTPHGETMAWPTTRLIEGWSPQQRQARIGWTYVGDESTQRVPLLRSYGPKPEDTQYALAVLLAARLKEVPIEHLKVAPDRSHLLLGDERVPLDSDDGGYQINYLWGGSLNDQALTKNTGDPTAVLEARGLEAQQRFNCLPFYAPFEMSDSDLTYYFKDRVVLVGVTAAAGYDVKKTPMGNMAGMDVHANLLLNLLAGQHLRTPGTVETALLTVLASFLACLLVLASPIVGALLCLTAGGLLYTWLPPWLLMRDVLLEPAGFLASMAASAVFAGAWRYYQEKRTKQRLSELIKKVAPINDHLVDNFLRSRSESLALKGESVRLTVMFSDVRGYTGLSEKLDSQTMFDTLNVLYTETGHIIHAHHGAIFEYLGDAQMVLFGLNPEHPDHEEDALRASVAMVERVRQLNESWQSHGQPALEVGVGLCTGTVALGFMGSQQRQQYSVIGDTVNTAARLQGMSAQLGSSIVVSAATQEALGPGWHLTRQSGIRLKGKAQEVTVYLHPEGSATSAANAPSKTGGEPTHG